MWPGSKVTIIEETEYPVIELGTKATYVDGTTLPHTEQFGIIAALLAWIYKKELNLKCEKYYIVLTIKNKLYREWSIKERNMSD